MDALTLLREQMALVDSLVPQVVDTVTPELAAWRAEGSTANPIGLTLVHMYATEDRILGSMQGRAPILESDGWAQRLGVDPQDPWAAGVAPDLAVVRGYATAVAADTGAWLDTITAATLGEVIDGPRGPRPRAALLSIALVIHKMGHIGEVSTILGINGLRGFPI